MFPKFFSWQNVPINLAPPPQTVQKKSLAQEVRQKSVISERTSKG